MLSKKVIGIILTKVSLITMLTASYFTYLYHEPIRRVVGNLMHEDVVVEKGYFRDPYGLKIEDKINEDGKREVYLIHAPSEKRMPIKEDFFPDTGSMLEGILKRTENGEGSKEERKSYLNKISQIEKKLYDDL